MQAQPDLVCCDDGAAAEMLAAAGFPWAVRFGFQHQDFERSRSTPAGITAARNRRGAVQAKGAVVTLLLVALIRRLSLRLQPKAVAAPKTGRGPGTSGAEPEGT